MKRLSLLAVWACLAGGTAACGLSDDPREEEKRHEYLVFADPAFAAWLLREADADGDGRISRYEAERMRRIECAGCGIGSLGEIGDFTNLRTLVCPGNRLEELDLRGCRYLEHVDCSGNRLRTLDVEGLRNLVTLECGDNDLERLDLSANVSLRTLRCSADPLSLLNVAACAADMAEVDARACPLQVFYKRAGQHIRILRLDDPDIVQDLR